MEMNADAVQKLGMLMQLAENDKSPAARAVQALLTGLADEAKGKSKIGLLVNDFVLKACDLKDPVYEQVDPMLKASLSGMFKTVKLMLED